MAEEEDAYAKAVAHVLDHRIVEVTSVMLDAPVSEKGVDAWRDLPLKPFDRRARRIRNLVVAFEHNGAIDFEGAREAFVAKRWENLPEPLATTQDTTNVQFTAQFLAVPMPTPAGADPPKHFIVKHYTTKADLNFTEAKKFGPEETLYAIDWKGQNFAAGRKAFQYLFEKIGGAVFAAFGLEVGDADAAEGKKLLSKEEVDLGFDSIEAHAPRSNARNEQLRWIFTELNDRGSPIYRFPRGTIQQAIDNLKAAALQVRTQT